MITAPQVPGVRFEVQPRPAAPTALRSDVAGLIGRTRRGPIGRAVRVEGYREFLGLFGPLQADSPFTYSVRGYFENGGQVAYIFRIASGDTETASATWDTTQQFDSNGRRLTDQLLTGFQYKAYNIVAASPGAWARDLSITINYELVGPDRRSTVRITVRSRGEATEQIRDLLPDVTPAQERRGVAQTMEARVAEESNLIRLVPDPGSKIVRKKDGTLRDSKDAILSIPNGRARNQNRWPASSFEFKHTATARSNTELRREYLRAIEAMGDRPEVAILAMPGLYDEIKLRCEDKSDGKPETTKQTEESPGTADLQQEENSKPAAVASVERSRLEIIQLAATEAAQLQDRLVLVDVPPDASGGDDPVSLVGFAQRLRGGLTSPLRRRAVAIYHPPLFVADPLGGRRQPFRPVAVSGHVAGVISRVDREVGATQTPANVPVLDAINTTETFTEDVGEFVPDEGLVSFNDVGVNLIRCLPNRGLLVWGGRTLDVSAEGKFVAHRRFIHRLIRAIRRAADPIVFEVNGPEVWLVLIRAITSVLLEAFRGGALRGATPEEAFFVRCDEQTNPDPQREQGQLVCNIGLALAAPMEFITLRIALSEQGEVEVFDQ